MSVLCQHSDQAGAKVVVGVADMKVSDRRGDVLVTHALGSCLGVAVYDPTAQVGGLLHVMMPSSEANPEKAAANPYMFVDTGVPAFFRALYADGGMKGRLQVRVAGGAASHSGSAGGGEDYFAIGKRNFVMLRKIFWKNGILIRGEDVGGSQPRTMYLEIGTGRVWLHSGGIEKEL